VATPDQRIGRITAAMTHAAWRAAIDADVSAILCCTRSGSTAKAMAAFRPNATLLGLTPNSRTRNQLSLVWGVTPIELPDSNTIDEVVENAIDAARQAGCGSAGEIVAVLAGSPDAGVGRTDLLRLVRLN
jgi:pyruvate kinase